MPIYLICEGVFALRQRSYAWKDRLFEFEFLVAFCLLLTVFDAQLPRIADTVRSHCYPGAVARGMRPRLGGAPLFYIYYDLPHYNLAHLIGAVGTSVCALSLGLDAVLRFRGSAWARVYEWLAMVLGSLCVRRSIDPEQDDPLPAFVAHPGAPGLRKEAISSQHHQEGPVVCLGVDPSPKRPDVSRNFNTARPPIRAEAHQNGYQIPTLSLLHPAKKIDPSLITKDLKKQAEALEEALLSFGLETKVGQINCGPTVTLFEVLPPRGMKVEKIKALQNNIALHMQATSIRIIAPIPGKAAVGIELPNAHPQEVNFREMITSYQEGSKRFHIPVLLGKAVDGEYVMSDLAKMPHCIIAGTTGSGKSVCINTIVMSILLNATPDQIKLIMIDPKKVELTPYTNLPHMLAPVITEPHGAAAALQWLVKEMERRYEILKCVGVRNIEAFNQRTPHPSEGEEHGREIPANFPYIVGIIDELADLMMVAAHDIETPIARIAQMARAVGIHLILATQRPSREVITGLIKANFPVRISFQVANQINSRIVLDSPGAESLAGKGDMLFLPPGSPHLVRVQGAYIRDDEIQSVIRCIEEQAAPQYLIPSFDHMQGMDAGDRSASTGQGTDPLFLQAKEIVCKTGNASTTFLQRKLKIGYARAASLMDLLEQGGVVGPAEGSRPRKVFAKDKSLEHQEEDEFL